MTVKAGDIVINVKQDAKDGPMDLGRAIKRKHVEFADDHEAAKDCRQYWSLKERSRIANRSPPQSPTESQST